MASTYDAASGPATGAFAVVPSDATDFVKRPRALWVGGTGALSVVFNDGTTATISAVAAGSRLPFLCRRVNATGTTATLIVGLL